MSKLPAKDERLSSICANYCRLIEEFGQEEKAPPFLSFPDSVWEIQHFLHISMIYKRAETKDAMRALFRAFHSGHWGKTWSRTYINRALAEAVCDAVEGNNETGRLRIAMQRAIDTLDAPPPEYRVVMALSGVHAMEPLAFGPQAQVYQMNEGALGQIAGAFDEILLTTPHDEKERDELRSERDKDIRKLLDWTVAEVRVQGDVAKAFDDAPAAAEPMLDLLQLLAIQSTGNIRIVPRIIPGVPLPFIILSASGDHALWRYTFEGLHRMNVSSSNLRNLQEVDRAGALVDAVGKEPSKRSDYDDLLVRSLHWVADGERQDASANKVTSYVTSIELFFSPDKDDRAPIVRDVTEGVAFALATDRETRKNIATLVSKAYAWRSGVSHHGKQRISPIELHQVRSVAVHFLFRMSQLAPYFEKRVDIRAWMRDVRLSGIDPHAAHAPKGDGEA